MTSLEVTWHVRERVPLRVRQRSQLNHDLVPYEGDRPSGRPARQTVEIGDLFPRAGDVRRLQSVDARKPQKIRRAPGIAAILFEK
jgi:hypothetical protein